MSDAATLPAPASASRSLLGRVPKVFVGILVLGFVCLWWTSVQDFYNLYVFNRVLLACIGAIGLNVLMGTAGQVSLGNSAFLLVGAFTTVISLRAGVPFPLDIVFAGLAAGVIGLIAGLPALRLRSLFLALSTLSLHFIALFLANKYQGSVEGAASAGFRVDTLFGSKGLEGGQRYWTGLLFVVVSLLLVGTSRLVGTRTGRGLRMIRDHELVAASFGIAVRRYKLAVFVCTSMVIGVGGSLTAHFTGSVQADTYTLLIAIQAVAMILIGGLDSLLGSVIGATIVTALPQYLPRWITSLHLVGDSTASAYGPQVSQMVYGVLLIIFITASPDGIAGWLRGLRRFRRWRAPGADASSSSRPNPTEPADA